MKKLILFLAIGLCALSLSAQEYEKSGGVRLGNTSGITYKTFIFEEEAIELMLSGRQNGMQFTANYIFHQPLEIAFDDKFYVYYGLGAHIGYEKYQNLRPIATSFDPPSFRYDDKNYFVIGADAIIGVEYRWLSVPVTIGFDVKPYFNFVGMRFTNGQFWDAALSVKYIF
jgi:hypothetical protein